MKKRYILYAILLIIVVIINDTTHNMKSIFWRRITFN